MLDVAEWEEAEAPFEETAWSIVLAAGAETDARAHAAMAELCRIYWRPIYAYLRRCGYDTHDAQDLTQSFFQHLLENETLRRVSREKGRTSSKPRSCTTCAQITTLRRTKFWMLGGLA